MYSRSEPWKARQVPPAMCPGLVHRAEPGESLTIISQRFGVPLADLLAANRDIIDPNQIITGVEVCLPIPQVPGLPLHPPMPPGIPAVMATAAGATGKRGDRM